MKELQTWVRGLKESEGFAIVEERQKQYNPNYRLLVGRPSLLTRSMLKQIPAGGR
jgi:hypothetical protein